MTPTPFFLTLILLIGTVPLPPSGTIGASAREITRRVSLTASPAAACETPIRWRIAEVDPRFGITEDEAARAIREAGMLWEAAAGRILMFRESSEGIPVRFVYDERQEATQARQAGLASLMEQDSALQQSEAAIETIQTRLARRRIIHEARLMNFEDRLDSHDEMVEYWNDRGGAPPEELERLRLAEDELEAVRLSANEAAAEVNTLVEELNQATERLNREIEEANQARAELEEQFPAQRVQSGQYFESRTGLGRITFSREVEIRIFQFEDRDHLLLVIAHELGHALGLEHTGSEGTLMAEAVVTAPGQGRPEVQPADVEELVAVCPEL